MSNLNKWIILHNAIPCCMRNGIMPIFMFKLDNIHTFRSIYCCDISFICYIHILVSCEKNKYMYVLSIFYNLIVMKLTNNSVIFIQNIHVVVDSIFTDKWKVIYMLVCMGGL